MAGRRRQPPSRVGCAVLFRVTRLRSPRAAPTLWIGQARGTRIAGDSWLVKPTLPPVPPCAGRRENAPGRPRGGTGASNGDRAASGPEGDARTRPGRSALRRGALRVPGPRPGSHARRRRRRSSRSPGARSPRPGWSKRSAPRCDHASATRQITIKRSRGLSRIASWTVSIARSCSPPNALTTPTYPCAKLEFGFSSIARRNRRMASSCRPENRS